MCWCAAAAKSIAALTLPPSATLGNTGGKTVAAIAPNTKDVEEFFNAQLALGEDWMIRLPYKQMMGVLYHCTTILAYHNILVHYTTVPDTSNTTLVKHSS